MTSSSADPAGRARSGPLPDRIDVPAASGWAALPVGVLDCAAELVDLEASLDCGQAFRWRRAPDGAWLGVVGARAFRLWKEPPGLRFQAWPDDGDPAAELVDYLRLDVDLAAVQDELRELDPRMPEAIALFPGLRVLSQPAQEALLTFVCSPASNIVRITRSVDRLARLYGRPIGQLGDQPLFAFPEAAALADQDPVELTGLTGLGFRGRNLCRVAAAVRERPPGWPAPLRAVDHDLARRELMELPSIGPKIADCVALFGLRHDQSVPVDTHVWGIAGELFGARFRGRALTPAVYEEVRAAFRERFGPWAGWAQQYLFHARRVARALPLPSEVTLPHA